MRGDNDPEADEERRWQEEFDRRSRETRAGLHHPLLHELILRMPPLHDSYDTDGQVYAGRLISRLAEEGITDGLIVQRLRALTLVPTHRAYRAASCILEAAYDDKPMFDVPHLAEASARFDYFAAVKGCRESAFRVAGRALAYAYEDSLPGSARLALFPAALGWLLRAGWDLPDVIERLGPQRGGSPASRAAELGQEMFRHIEVLLKPFP